MASDTDRLRERLRAMTVPQLRGRWKRIEERLQDPLRVIASALKAPTTLQAISALDSPHPALLPLREAAQAVSEGDTPTTDEAREAALTPAARLAAEALLEADGEGDEVAASLLESLEAAKARLERAREMLAQRQLVEAELESRGAASPAEEPPLFPLAERKPPEAAPAAPREPEGEPGDGWSQRISEATKSVTTGAAKASGKALWKAVTSGFSYSTKGPAKPPIPVKRSPRRRRNGNSGSEDTLALIERLHELKERGILDEEEFQTKKADLLERL